MKQDWKVQEYSVIPSYLDVQLTVIVRMFLMFLFMKTPKILYHPNYISESWFILKSLIHCSLNLLVTWVSCVSFFLGRNVHFYHGIILHLESRSGGVAFSFNLIRHILSILQDMFFLVCVNYIIRIELEFSTLNNKILNCFTSGITRSLYSLWLEGSCKKKPIGGSGTATRQNSTKGALR